MSWKLWMQSLGRRISNFGSWMLNVIIGNFNNLFRRENKLAKERLDVCKNCDEKIKIAGVWVCGQCGCPLQSKARAPKEKCLMNKW